MIVVGVDGYPKGWVGVILRDGEFRGAVVAPSLAAIAAAVPEAVAIGVDMPIGLPDDRPRAADARARRFVGPRGSSVFAVLPRDVLTAPDIGEARRRSIERLGISFSSQAWALRARILEADGFGRDPRVREVHPEVSFRAMAGEHLRHPKSSWAGMVLRRGLLASHGIELPDELDEAGVAGVDDVLDAAAAAWSAHRIATGQASSLPQEPEVGSDGHRAAIWY